MTDNTPIEGKLETILAKLAEDLINYDKRMGEANAPDIRFVHKYIAPAKKRLLALIPTSYPDLDAREEELYRIHREFDQYGTKTNIPTSRLHKYISRRMNEIREIG
jgi:hypothetical protein